MTKRELAKLGTVIKKLQLLTEQTEDVTARDNFKTALGQLIATREFGANGIRKAE